MPAGYPYGLDNFGSVTDGVDTVSAAHVNTLRRSVEALETKVGVNNSSDPNSLDYKVRNGGGAAAPSELYGAPACTVNNEEVQIQLRGPDALPVSGRRNVIVWLSLSNTNPDPTNVGSVVTSVTAGTGTTRLPTSSGFTLELVSDASALLRINVTASDSTSVYVWVAIGGQVFVSMGFQFIVA